MSELTIRRIPVDDSAGSRQVIVQVPLVNGECYQIPDYLKVPNESIHWITPVQVSAHYTGVPAPGFTFTVRPGREGSGQWVDVWCNLEQAASILVGGPYSRITIGSNIDSGDLSINVAEAARQVTVAFLVQFEVPHEDTDNA
ncbi:hypothetical protein D3C87_1238650 [compost metagenome]